MSEGRSRFSWIYRLSIEQLREELSRRGQEIEGSTAVLHDRLLRYELDAPVSEGPSRQARDGASAALHPPIATPVRPDSPGHILRDCSGDRTDPRDASPPAESSPLRAASASTFPQASAVDIYNALRKWNLTFSGAHGGEAEAFLIRIEEGRELFPVSDQGLFRCLPFFLSGTALHWFRTRRSEWQTWDQFVTAWRRRFGDPDFQYALRDEIFRRTQGEHESVADYLTCMQALFNRLSPSWDLTEQLNYAHRNMLPRVQIALRRDEFRDFATLELLASRIEVSCKAATNYRAPPAPEKSLFPELAYRSPRKVSRGSPTSATGLSAPVVTGSRKDAGRGRVGAVASGPSAAAVPGTSAGSAATPVRPVSTVKCWNCERVGHIARECGERRRTYCFRCGRPNVTVKACPTCSGNAEESR